MQCADALLSVDWVFFCYLFGLVCRQNIGSLERNALLWKLFSSYVMWMAAFLWADVTCVFGASWLSPSESPFYVNGNDLCLGMNRRLSHAVVLMGHWTRTTVGMVVLPRIMVKYWMTNSSDWTHKRSDFDIGYFLPCAHWPRSRTSKKNKTNTIIRSQLIQRFAFFHPPELYDHLKRFGRRPTSTLIIIIH